MVVALGVLHDPADSVLAAHMLQHVLIGDLVPLLLILAVRGPMLFHLVPIRFVRVSRRIGVQHVLALAARPAPALLVWSASLAAWHVPAIYDRALESEPLHGFEHLTFMLSGLLVWAALLDPARRGLLPGWRRFGYALALLALSGVLANTLILSYRPIYPAYATSGSGLGLSPKRDQDLAGLVMMLEQLATLGALAVVVARQQLLSSAGTQQPARHPLAT
jgi:cytochrome c oxidase assembly factor CtaG